MNITIGITTFNRLKYSRSLLNSIRGLSNQHQVIVVDNCSTENGLKEHLENEKKSGLIHKLFSRDPEERNWTNDEYIAKNIIIESAENEVILFLQDDLQFIATSESLNKTVEDFMFFNEMLSLTVNAVRRSTINNQFDDRFSIENNYKYYKPLDNHFPTMGFFKKSIFEKYGKYPVNWPQTQEYWGRSEDWYDSHLKSKLRGIQLNYSSWVPLFAPVWNDPRGGYAFIRGNKRYGYYLDAPSDSGTYYEKISTKEFEKKQSSLVPLGFVDICKPLGWNYQTLNGDQAKYPQSKVLLEGPIGDL